MYLARRELESENIIVVVVNVVIVVVVIVLVVMKIASDSSLQCQLPGERLFASFLHRQTLHFDLTSGQARQLCRPGHVHIHEGSPK